MCGEGNDYDYDRIHGSGNNDSIIYNKQDMQYINKANMWLYAHNVTARIYIRLKNISYLSSQCFIAYYRSWETAVNDWPAIINVYSSYIKDHIKPMINEPVQSFYISVTRCPFHWVV